MPASEGIAQRSVSGYKLPGPDAMIGLPFPGKGGGGYDLNLVFPPISRVDPKVDTETISLLNIADAISTETAVRRANPDADADADADEQWITAAAQGIQTMRRHAATRPVQ